jgi:hypothetical protein
VILGLDACQSCFEQNIPPKEHGFVAACSHVSVGIPQYCLGSGVCLKYAFLTWPAARTLRRICK